MGMIKKKKCRHCRRLFIPDHRNRDRQTYCKKAECRKASKAASQKKWLDKPDRVCFYHENKLVARHVRSAAFSCEYIVNLLEQRSRPVQELGALHLTRISDLLDLTIDHPDLSIYNNAIDEDKNE